MRRPALVKTDVAATTRSVADWWNRHLNGTQVLDTPLALDDPRLFETITRTRYARWPFVAEAIDRLDLPGRRVLEVGCGLGADLARIAARGADVTGIDLAPRAAALARAHLESRGLPGRTMVADGERLPFPDATFDLVWSFGVLHHAPDTRRALAEVGRVLRPGGTAAIMLYHRRSWYHLLARLSGTAYEFEGEDPPVVRVYDKDEIVPLFPGLQVTEIRLEGLPTRTTRRGPLAAVYNAVAVPLADRCAPLLRPFAWNLLITARKR